MLDSETQFKSEFSQHGLGPVYKLISKFLDSKLANSPEINTVMLYTLVVYGRTSKNKYFGLMYLLSAMIYVIRSNEERLVFNQLIQQIQHHWLTERPKLDTTDEDDEVFDQFINKSIMTEFHNGNVHIVSKKTIIANDLQNIKSKTFLPVSDKFDALITGESRQVDLIALLILRLSTTQMFKNAVDLFEES